MLATFTSQATTLRDSFFSLFQRCVTVQHLFQTHTVLTTSGLSHDILLLPHLLLRFLAISPPCYLSYASILFDRIQTPDICLWNMMIRAFASSPEPEMSLVLFARMRRDGVAPSKHTFPALLKAFSKLKNETLFQVHAQIVKFGFSFDPFVRNSLISVFANGGCVGFARRVFDESLQRIDVVAWTAMIDGYARNGLAMEGLGCFLEMRSGGVRVDEVAIVSVLCAAGTVGEVWFGKWVHGFYIVSGRVPSDVYVGSALLDMYSKCGYCDDAHKVFDEMPRKNVVSWSTLMAGYVHCHRFQEVLRIFQDMLLKDVPPNEFTLSSVLTACAQLGALDRGRWIHRYLDNQKLELSSTLGTALIDMYAKCGCMKEAFFIFRQLPCKDVYPWTAMINGLAMHGDALGSLNLFSCMFKNGVQPNEVTFVGVLSACSHGGLIDEGRKFFRLMSCAFRLEPDIEHYGCMIDLFGRAGCLEEALKLIANMPMEPTPVIWGALFAACMIHRDFVLGELVGKRLIELQPHHGGTYALLANLYSACREWKANAHVRRLMKWKAVRKTPGCSWIEMNGVIHEFTSFDRSHAESVDVYLMVDRIMDQLKHVGCSLETKMLPLAHMG
ncbi:pentatricopeptide repeat-containing protein At1g50270 [Malania oleifera]|uniref:pentatricopeptide repeat-containing protein At1g50270 n=1 Tax=Malania oleifera TaxID=397392 RepID=UPI0025AE2631|nr:pentatricopeptide repeat-containing protein At1g50270 [Malania oleifera]